MRNPLDSNLFDDSTILKIAEKVGIKVMKPVEERTDRIKISSSQIGNDVQSLGGGFVKHAHKVWELKKEGEEYFLERLEDED